MTPHTQAFLHDPDAGVRGDCYRTAVACVLDLPRDEVPQSHDPRVDRDKVRGYLEDTGFAIVGLPLRLDDLRTVLGWMRVENPGATYLLSGRTVWGTDHVVVVHGDGEIHDPHPSRDGLSGPMSVGYWHVETLARR